MKTLVSMVLLLAPVSLNAALVFEDCCSDSPAETLVNAAPPAPCEAVALNQLGARLYTAGDYSNAEKNLRAALAMEQAQANCDPRTHAGTLFNLAAVERMMSRLPESESLYNRAIAAIEGVAGPDSPDLARPFDGLALVRMAEGQLAPAMDAAERAVRVSPKDPVAQNTLATLLMARGDSLRARAIEQKVVDQLEAASATASHDYVNALTNLGTSRLRLGHYGQAERDLRKAEAVSLKVAGPNHPMTATVWNNLAKTRAAEGDWKDAEGLFRKAIAAWRTSFGPTHPDVAYGLSNLATLYQSRKKYPEADRLFRQAIAIDEASLGPDSLKVANDWDNLGALLAARHHYRDAESAIARGLEIAGGKVGFEHPDTAGIEVNLALVYYSEAKYVEASRLFARALPVKARVLGPDSAELAGLLRVYAGSLKAAHDYVSAERVDLQATRILTHNALL